MHRHMPALGPGAAGAGAGILCPAASQGGVYMCTTTNISVSLWDPMGWGAYLLDGQRVCEGFALERKFCCSPCAGDVCIPKGDIAGRSSS